MREQLIQYVNLLFAGNGDVEDIKPSPALGMSTTFSKGREISPTPRQLGTARTISPLVTPPYRNLRVLPLPCPG